MIVKDVNILEKNNFINNLLRKLCTQNVSYVLIENKADDDKKCLELHFDKYIYRFHEISYEESSTHFMKSHLQVLEEVSFNNNTFIDDSIALEEETRKKGKSGNKRYTKKDMKNDRNKYKISNANYKLR